MLRVLKQTFKIVITNIYADRVRSFMTCLGIIIGVASLIGMMSIYDIRNQHSLEDALAQGYADIPISRYDGQIFSNTDLEKFRAIDGVAGISPSISLNEKIAIKSEKSLCKKVSVTGRGTDYYKYSTANRFIYGRPYSKEEENNGRYVCVINKALSDKLFPKKDPTGKQITVYGVSMEIIGVTEKNGHEIDQTVTIPYTTMYNLTGYGPTEICIYPENPEEAASVDVQVRAVLDKMFHGLEYIAYYDDFYPDMLEQTYSDANRKSVIQIVVAIISMVIGGIGIMNMMLVMVSERAVEIGLRKALGATPKRIQLQFVLESTILSVVGGVIGVVVGLIIAIAFCISASEPIHINLPSLPAGLIFSLAVGVFFGWAPAKSASQKDPIECLKGE